MIYNKTYTHTMSITVQQMLDFRDEFNKIVEFKHVDPNGKLDPEREAKFMMLKSLVTAYYRLVDFGLYTITLKDVHEEAPKLDKVTRKRQTRRETLSRPPTPIPSTSMPSTSYSSSITNDYLAQFRKTKVVIQTEEEKEQLQRSIERALEQYNFIKLNKWVRPIDDDENIIEYETTVLVDDN